MNIKSSGYYAVLREELAVAVGEVAATSPQNLWPAFITYMLEELEAEADQDFEAVLKAIRDDIEARLITGEW